MASQGPWDPIPGDTVRVRYGAKVRLPDGTETEAHRLSAQIGKVVSVRYSGALYSGTDEADIEGIGTVAVVSCEVQPPNEGPQAEAYALKVSYKSVGRYWRGVLKGQDRKVVWECGHLHANRDLSSRSNGEAARSCAAAERHRRILIARHGEAQGQKYFEASREIAKLALCGR